MRAVNLLPADATPRRSFRGPGLVIVAGATVFAVSVAGLGVAYSSARSTVASRQDELAAVQVQIAAAPKPLRPVSPAELQLAGDRSVRIQALNAALTGRVSWDRVLRQLSLVLPEDVWLTDLTGTAPVAPPPIAPTIPPGSSTSSSTTTTSGTPTPVPTTPAPTTPSGACGVCLTGFTYSQESVARLLARLAAVPSLSNVELQSSVSQDLANQTLYQFKVSADLNQGGGS